LDVADSSSYALLTGDLDTSTRAPNDLNGVITINRIDGMELFGARYRYNYPETVYLKPGAHKVYVQFRKFYSTANECFEIDAVAGETYIVRRHAVRYVVQLWFENKATGEVVGNVCGLKKRPPQKPTQRKGIDI